MAWIEVIPGSIDCLRKIDKKRQPHLYRATVDLFLDFFKYNIKDAAHKSGIRRKIERKFKGVVEIPNLIDLIAE